MLPWCSDTVFVAFIFLFILLSSEESLHNLFEIRIDVCKIGVIIIISIIIIIYCCYKLQYL